MSVSGVGAIEAHLLQADFWPGTTSGLPVILLETTLFAGF
jgi:hypothetical protein